MTGQSGWHQHDRACNIESKVKSFGWQNVFRSKDVLVPLCPSNRQFTVTLQCDVFDVPTSYRDISAFYLEIPLTHWSKTRGTSFGSCESHQLAAVQRSKWLKDSLGAATSVYVCQQEVPIVTKCYKGCHSWNFLLQYVQSLWMLSAPPWTKRWRKQKHHPGPWALTFFDARRHVWNKEHYDSGTISMP